LESRDSPSEGRRESFEERWRARFREFAEIRDDDAGIAGWSPSGLDSRLRRFTGLWARPRDRGLWLDAGCGAGTYMRFLKDNEQSVIGVDYSLLALQKAVARSPDAGHYVVSDVRKLPFRPGGFDGIICFGVMQALADSAPALRELAANMRPNGELWVDALNGWCFANAAHRMRRWLGRRPMHLRYESPRKIRQILRSQGLDDIDLHWMPIVPARWARLQRWLERPLAQRAVALVPLAGLLFSHAFIVSARRPVVTPPRDAAK
jgi:SAM-dependent methyltransferase